MDFVRSRALLVLLAAPLFLNSCGGAATQDTTPAIQTVSQPGAPQSSSRQTFSLPAMQGFSGTVALSATRALPPASVRWPADRTNQPGAERVMSAQNTFAPLTIELENSSPFPITIEIESFSFTIPCMVNGKLFGATFYQTKPKQHTVSPTKLGDATGKGSTLTFEPTVEKLTLPAHSTSVISVREEASTADVAFPVVPGSTTVLTANAPNVPQSLSFTYAQSTGASSYSAGCFNAHTASGALVPALRNVPLVGTPSFYCRLDAGNSSVSFGTTVKFSIGAPKPDASIFELDGTAQGYACTGPVGSPNCTTRAFNVPQFQNAIVGNVKDLTLCVPARRNTDCNNLNQSPWPPASVTSVPAGKGFQLLVADDPTYKPGTPAAPVPWDGLVRIATAGSCSLETRQDNDNGDVPPSPFPGRPGYSDDGPKGVGPYAEFDIRAGSKGTCAVTVSEGLKYITDLRDPANPRPRSTTLTLTVR